MFATVETTGCRDSYIVDAERGRSRGELLIRVVRNAGERGRDRMARRVLDDGPVVTALIPPPVSHSVFRLLLIRLEVALTSTLARVSFARHIRPLFRPIDVAHMLPFNVNLGAYEYMADPTDSYRNARTVLAFLSGARQPRMPIGGPFWTEAQLKLYERWMSDGCQP